MELSNPQTFTTFGSLLRVLRRRAQLTQREFGDHVGYSDAQINRYERGLRMPDPSVVAGLFVSALGLASEPELAGRLVELAQKSVFAGVTTPNLNQQPLASLPNIANRFFGRDGDIHELKLLFAQSDSRLVTLVGPPGIGKTRLAIHLATEHERESSNHVLFVSLASIAESDFIADAMLHSLDVSSDSTDPQRQLEHVLRAKQLLIVLDNFEQLLTESNALKSANVVANLLAAAPKIRIIVTSRAALRLSQEYVYEVPALDANAAQALFISRASAIQPSRAHNFQNDPAIPEICQKLDYLPLAIELAAARSRLFDPASLLRYVTEPLNLLTNGPRDLPHRQRTLRDAIAGSYELLSANEKLIFRSLSVFADGCTLPMIEAIANDLLPHEVIDLAQGLIEKSLLKVEHADNSAQARFRMLEMIHEYASERLAESGEREATIEAMAQWFVEQVETMLSDLPVGDSAVWFDWFDAEINNLRSIIQWSMHSNRLEYGMRLAAQLGITWRLHGPVREGLQLLEQLTSHPQAQDDHLLYAKVLVSKANVTKEASNLALSKTCFTEALAIFRQFGDKENIAWVLSHLGDRACGDADYALARQLLDESITLFQEVNDQKGLAWALIWLAMVCSNQGDFEQALRHCTQARGIADAIRSPIMAYLTAGWTAFTYFAYSDYDQARKYAEAALEICLTTK